MSRSVIQVRGLGKRYRVGEREPYLALRDVLARALHAPFRGREPRTIDHVWAVRDVSFDVHQGEVVGLIGRNGAGKTTLMKLLSRIAYPTEGFAEVRGRIGSLLEVGTGFHPELTGRENVFLSGAVLGMKRAEIIRKFDEIVAFAGVERFIDTPLKHFSTGMQMRLAFAVAAHLEPEILLIDEVLAVGDLEFQKKCLGKMEEVSRAGRTILFVSHNAAAVTRLCERCILLNSGCVQRDGPVHEVMGAYLRSGLDTSACREWDVHNAPGDDVVRLRAVRVRRADGGVGEAFDIRRPIRIDIVFDVLQSGSILTPNLHIFNQTGVNVFISHDVDPVWRGRRRASGRYTSTAWIPGNLLSEGTFLVGAAITTLISQNIRLYERDAVAFQVVDSDDGDSARGDYAGPLPGIVRPLLKWETSYEPTSVEKTAEVSAGDREL